MLFPFILHSPPKKWDLVIIPGTASGAIRIFLIFMLFPAGWKLPPLHSGKYQASEIKTKLDSCI